MRDLEKLLRRILFLARIKLGLMFIFFASSVIHLIGQWDMLYFETISVQLIIIVTVSLIENNIQQRLINALMETTYNSFLVSKKLSDDNFKLSVKYQEPIMPDE
jgi:hypothetical protein